MNSLPGLGISRATLQTIVGSRHDLQCLQVLNMMLNMEKEHKRRLMGERAQVLSGNGSALLGGAGSGDEALPKDLFREQRA